MSKYSTWGTQVLEDAFDGITNLLNNEPSMVGVRSEIGEELYSRFPFFSKYAEFGPKAAQNSSPELADYISTKTTPASFPVEAAQCNQQEVAGKPEKIEPLDPNYVTGIRILFSPSVTDPAGEAYATIYFDDARGFNHYPVHIPRIENTSDINDDGFAVLRTIIDRLIARKKNCNEFETKEPSILSPRARAYFDAQYQEACSIFDYLRVEDTKRGFVKFVLDRINKYSRLLSKNR